VVDIQSGFVNFHQQDDSKHRTSKKTTHPYALLSNRCKVQPFHLVPIITVDFCTKRPRFSFLSYPFFSSDAGADFELEWQGRNVRIKTSNNKYVSVLPSGHLSVGADGQAEDFVLRLTNRYL